MLLIIIIGNDVNKPARGYCYMYTSTDVTQGTRRRRGSDFFVKDVQCVDKK